MVLIPLIQQKGSVFFQQSLSLDNFQISIFYDQLLVMGKIELVVLLIFVTFILYIIICVHLGAIGRL